MNNKGSNIEPSGTPVWICDKSDSIKKNTDQWYQKPSKINENIIQNYTILAVHQ